MPKVGTAYLIIRAKLDQLAKDFHDARTLTERRTRELVRAANTAMLGFGTLIGAYGFGKIIDSLDNVIDKASDLQESTSKFETVFRGQVDIAQQWSQSLVDSYGLSLAASREYLSSVQDLLVPMGMVPDAAARMSNEIVKLSVDLGSFNNKRTADVMRDIESALVGNYETMKKYGVVLNENAVKQEALNSGLITSKKDLDASSKAQAAYSLIVKGSQAAVGDFSRTSDEYANTTRRLDAAWENLSSTIGTKFINAATKAKGATADLLNEFNKILTGPSIDEQIAAAEARLAELTKTPEIKREEAFQRYLENEKRIEQLQTGQIARNREATEAWEDYDRALRKSIEGIEDRSSQTIKIAEWELDYLKDLKHFQDLMAHEEKKKSLIGFGIPEPRIIHETEAELNKLEAEMRRIDAAIRASNENPWDPIGYDIDTGGIINRESIQNSKLAAAIQQFELELNNKRIQTARSIAAQAGIEDTYGADWDNLKESADDSFDYMIELSERTAEAMENNFADLFFDIMKWNFSDLGDFASRIADSIIRIYADLAGQLTRESLFGGGPGWGGFLKDIFGSTIGVGGKNPYAPVHIGAGGTTAFKFAEGGYLGETVHGIGLSSGKSYELHKNEFVIPPDKLGFGGGGNITANVTVNLSAVDAQSFEGLSKRYASIIADSIVDKLTYSVSHRNAFKGVLN